MSKVSKAVDPSVAAWNAACEERLADREQQLAALREREKSLEQGWDNANKQLAALQEKVAEAEKLRDHWCKQHRTTDISTCGFALAAALRSTGDSK